MRFEHDGSSTSYRCKVDGDGPVVVEQSFDFTRTDE
jgi:hypothetical protein